MWAILGNLQFKLKFSWAVEAIHEFVSLLRCLYYLILHFDTG